MKRSIFIILMSLVFTAAFAGERGEGTAEVPGEKRAYVIYDAEGVEVTYGDLLDAFRQKDVVFFGEIHYCPVAHWLELELVKDLYAEHGDKLMLGAEMFERDDQVILDEYLAGLVSDTRLAEEAKLWKNYGTDYRPLVEFAKSHHLPFIATNVARRYAAMVAKSGLAVLDSVSVQAREFIAPLPLDYRHNPFIDDLFCKGSSMKGMSTSSGEHLAQAQALKDATMAWSISRQIGDRKMVHFNGSFHTTDHAGILTYLELYRPGLRTGCVEVVIQEDVEKMGEEMKGRADFIICVPSSMTRTY